MGLLSEDEERRVFAEIDTIARSGLARSQNTLLAKCPTRQHSLFLSWQLRFYH